MVFFDQIRLNPTDSNRFHPKIFKKNSCHSPERFAPFFNSPFQVFRQIASSRAWSCRKFFITPVAFRAQTFIVRGFDAEK